MAVERAFLVKLLVDSKELTKGFQQASDQVNSSLGSAFGKVQLAAAAAFAGLAAFGTKAAQAAIADAAEQERLATSLRNVVGATDATIAATEAYIASQARVTTFTDSEMRPALESLVRTTGDLGKAQELLSLAQDLAIGTGRPLVETADALARAQAGNMKSLQALSPALRDNIKDGQTFDQVLQELTATFGGQAAAAANTLGGRIQILKNRFGEVVESIGTALLPAIETLTTFLGKVATFAENNTEFITALGVAFAVFTGTIIAAGIALKVYTIAAATATAANSAFATSLSATGIGAIVVVIGLLIGGLVLAAQKSEGFRKFLVAALNFAIAGFEALVNSVITANNILLKVFNLIIDGLQLMGANIKNIAPVGEVSFGRVKLAADKAADAIANVGFQSDLAARRLAAANLETGLVSVAQAEAKLAQETQRVNQLRAQALKGGTSIEVLNQAIKDQSAAQAVLNALLGESSNKTRGASGATAQAKKPLEEYTKVLKSAQGASDNYERSTRRLRDAKKGLQQADNDLRAAQEALTAAQQAGSPAEIADAQRAVAAAERNVTRGKFAGEEAAFAVADAEAKLKKTREDTTATAQDIRQAEIALAEAKLRVKDQEDEQINTARSLEKARRDLRIATQGLREGDEELLPLRAAVTRAEEAQIKAAEMHAEAVKEQASAVEQYREQLDLLAKAIIDFPKVSARVGTPGLLDLPAVPTPTPAATGTAPAPSTINANINVNSSVVNPAQVGQEIYEYLKDYVQVGGDVRLNSVL